MRVESFHNRLRKSAPSDSLRLNEGFRLISFVAFTSRFARTRFGQDSNASATIGNIHPSDPLVAQISSLQRSVSSCEPSAISSQASRDLSTDTLSLHRKCTVPSGFAPPLLLNRPPRLHRHCHRHRRLHRHLHCHSHRHRASRAVVEKVCRLALRRSSVAVMLGQLGGGRPLSVRWAGACRRCLLRWCGSCYPSPPSAGTAG